MLLGARDHLEGTLFSVLAWTLSHGGACAIIFDRPAHNGSWRSLVYFAEKILKNFRRLGACDITFDWSAHNCSRHTLCFFFGGGKVLENVRTSCAMLWVSRPTVARGRHVLCYISGACLTGFRSWRFLPY